ncbi:fungal specific transcription [Moniliophthora roreri MCA 2997]|uniref:Fungal specific transcription n=1 Tax=Moniliophthora roreri (strain MCA 2997) TaxID=1381753 RepID=V2X6J3_MONRO|nr:fungal specific transcription [Moniliophthora roreri MCA 2997]
MEVPASAPQIRSRITVVCAECKRLKLKCDRRTPCGSCQKRDTVSRCVYSPAAAEKVDLHSLNNRLIQVETMLAQITEGQFQPSYPCAPSTSMSSSSSVPPPPPPPPGASVSSIHGSAPMSTNHTSLAIPLEELSATWLNELEPGVLRSSYSRKKRRATLAATAPRRGPVKSEPSPVHLRMTSRSDSAPVQSLLPPTSIYYIPEQPGQARSLGARVTPELLALLPPLSPHHGPGPPFKISPSQNGASSLFTYNAFGSLATSEPLCGTSIAGYGLRQLLLFAEEALGSTHPWLNWKTFRDKVEIFVSCLSEDGTRQKKEKHKTPREKEELARARQILGITPSSLVGKKDRSNRPSSSPSAAMRNGNPLLTPSSSYLNNDGLEGVTSGSKGKEKANDSRSYLETNLPFFAMICIAIAIGIGEAKHQQKWTFSSSPARDNDDRMQVDMSMEASSSQQSDGPKLGPRLDPAYWYHLSNQAILLWESDRTSTASSGITQDDAGDASDDMDVDHDSKPAFTSTKKTSSGLEMEIDMDRMSALLLQVTFLCHGGLRVEDSTDVEGSEGSETSGEEKAVNHDVVPLLMGKIVALARQMRLHVDPDEYRSEENASSVPTEGKRKDGKQKARETSLKDQGSSSNPFTLFDSEMRRRTWWFIMYYDLFVSDVSTLPPLIPEGSFSTKVPIANVDETAFSPDSIRIPAPPGGGADGKGWTRESMRGLEARCHLVQLVRNTKRKMNGPVVWHGSYHGSYSIEQAASMEQEVKAWLDNLPEYYKVDMKASIPSLSTLNSYPPAPPIAVIEDNGPSKSSPNATVDSELRTGGEDSVLVTQRCELAIIAHRLILRIYLPFLRRNATDAVPHQATLGSINAAHGVICACRLLWSIWEAERSRAGKPRTSLPPSSLLPASCDFYPFARTVFDAAVVCSHAVIKQALSIISKPALEDVDVGLGILKSVAGWVDNSEEEDSSWQQGTRCDRQGAAGSEYVVSPSEAVKIVEFLREKASGPLVTPSENVNGVNVEGTNGKSKTGNPHSHLGNVDLSSSSPGGEIQSPTLKRKHTDDDGEHDSRRRSPGAPLPNASQAVRDRVDSAYVYPSVPAEDSDNHSHRPTIYIPQNPNPYTMSNEPVYSAPPMDQVSYPAPPPPPPILPPSASRPSSQTSPAVSNDGSTSSKSSSDSKKSKKPPFGIRVRPPKDAFTVSKTSSIANTPQPSLTYDPKDEASPVSNAPSQLEAGYNSHQHDMRPFNPPIMSTSQEQHQQAYRSRTSSIAHATGMPKFEAMDYPLKPLPSTQDAQQPAVAHHQPTSHELYPSQDALQYTSLPLPPHTASEQAPHQQVYATNSPAKYDHPRETSTYPPTPTYNPPRKNSIDAYTTAESPYGTANTVSSGPLSTASSPYTTGTPPFGQTPSSHGASPQGYVSNSPVQNYYGHDSGTSYQPRYDSTGRDISRYITGGTPITQPHAPQPDHSGSEGYARENSDIYPISEGMVYDVKPSVETLNQQQYPLKHVQPVYHHAYTTPNPSSSESPAQALSAMPLTNSQSWPQPNVEGQYWANANGWGGS